MINNSVVHSTGMLDYSTTVKELQQMYLQNKYTHIYNNIIERAKSRTISGYTEKHHIIPRSLGGHDSKDNLVALTAREHFVCHRLLTKMLEGEDRRKMCYAMKIMTTSNHHGLSYVPCARTFEYVREQARLSQIGVPLSKERKQKISMGNTGKIQTEETKKKRAASLKGQHRTEEQKATMRAAQSTAPRSPEVIAKIRAARKTQVITTVQVSCPHCGKTGGNRIMPRYHFDNCKHIIKDDKHVN